MIDWLIRHNWLPYVDVGEGPVRQRYYVWPLHRLAVWLADRFGFWRLADFCTEHLFETYMSPNRRN